MRSIRSIALLAPIALVACVCACGDDDAGSELDGGRGDTGMCSPPPCAAPPSGCRYDGPSCSSCGTLVCEDAGPTPCVSCAAPPPGCRLEGGSCAACGTLVCEDAGTCTPPPCAAPPMGCRYEGGGCTTCGTLVCEDGGVPVACGGRAGDPCADTEYCRYEAPSVCSADDSQGVCTAIPSSCPAGGEPVCGCDGTPYPSECEAARARIGIRSDASACGGGDDCRTTGCPGREHCELCRTTSGPAYVCLPEGAVC